MAERGLDAVVVIADELENPIFRYVTKGAKMLWGAYIKQRAAAPVLLHHALERDEAMRTGYETICLDRWNILEILKQIPDRMEATVEQYRRIFSELGIRGRVGFYGSADSGYAFTFLNRLQAVVPGLEIVGEHPDTGLFTAARMTKEPDEIEHIRRAARGTIETVTETVAFLRGHAVRDSHLVKPDGEPLTIGEVKRFIRQTLLKHGLVEPDVTIFSIGRDAGVGHNSGEDTAHVELGKSIVYDIFPRDVTSGYYFDMTRTFCLGWAPPEVEQAHREVSDCLDAILAALKPGTWFGEYQRLACEFFEARGHPTLQTDPSTQVGYNHSLGHGIGLEVHEGPYLRNTPDTKGVLEPGMVFTLEPGLYYPERGFGVRLEDVIYLDENGTFHNLTPYPRDLIIPMTNHSWSSLDL